MQHAPVDGRKDKERSKARTGQQQILEEVVKFSDKIRLKIFDFVKDGPEVTKYGIDKKLIKQKAVLDSWQQ